ncbi:MAG: hypothetical protein IJN54_06405 [Lachnospiraceae bacterium]|nr:hypothetical protein [Lachnospiraceae bacterium]
MGKVINKHKSKGHGGKKMLFIILGVVVAIILIVAVIVSCIANKNVKAMNSCVDSVLAELKKNYTVTPCDTGDYEEMKLFGLLKFHVEQYDIEEIGNLSIMRVNMGVMQMATVVITPKHKNIPLLSADYMYILSNRKCYLEFYDVVKEKDEQYNQLLSAISDAQGKYDYLENIETSPAWYEHLLTVTSYKAGKSDVDKDLEGILVDSLKVYIEHSKQFPLLSEDERNEKLDITLKYTDGLIEKGGISTDVFKKALGDEETKKFFDNVFFGTMVK